MKKIIRYFIYLFFLSTGLNAQNLINGDLEGVITGYSEVPPSWSVIDYFDVNCLATGGGTTPDLINQTLPGPAIGMIGTPFSGNTFVGGSHGISSSSGTIFQEGIKQSVPGFIIGQNYNINFHQSVVKVSQSFDTSGSWMVIVDDSIIGVSSPTVSHEPYNSISFAWESRSFSFSATQTTHVIKFLPYDDDLNLLSSPTDSGGSLYMGLDLVEIQPDNSSGITGIGVAENTLVYPNPFTSGISCMIRDHKFQHAVFTIKNITGQIIFNEQENNLNDIYTKSIDLSFLPKGVYLLEINSEGDRVVKKIVKK